MMRLTFRFRRVCARPSARTTRNGATVRRASAAVIAFASVLSGCATREVPPANSSLPESLRTPPTEVLQDALSARGETIYLCQRSGAQLAWVAKGSEATLVDAERRNVGTVLPGPRFTAYDGSYVEGHVAAQEVVAVDSLPWELIIARRKSGDARNQGRFSNVASIQQVRTHGGVPPQSGCPQQGLSILVPYSATYLIYRAAGEEPLAEPMSASPDESPPQPDPPALPPSVGAFGSTTMTIGRGNCSAASPRCAS